MHRAEKVVLGVIWEKTGKRKEGARIPKPGTQVEYQGKKYVSLKELSKDINIPYSPLIHRYYRTGDIEDAVAWATDVMEKKKSYVLWNRQCENLNSIALAFGLNPGSIMARMKENDSLEEIVSGLLQKETILFQGKEYKGISALATAYNHDPSTIFERLKYGFELERALLQPIRKLNRPELEITYRGKVYASKNELYRELGIAGDCIHEMMVNHGTDFETAVDIYWETKVKAGIPAEKMLSYLPVCIIKGRYYKTVVELANEIGINPSTIAIYKYRHGYEGVIDTLQAMRIETRERYILNGEVRTYKELLQMGYTSSSYRQVSKERTPVYPQLQKYDFTEGCVDVMKIYEEVKQEKLNMEQGMQMNM